jgi:membrane protease YdiL (CAAX protease family)
MGYQPALRKVSEEANYYLLRHQASRWNGLKICRSRKFICERKENQMKNLISRFPLVSFFVMPFLFTWIAILPLILNPTLPVTVFQILGAFAGPTISAIIIIAILNGRTGLREFFKRYIQLHAGIGWWLFILFGSLIALTIVASLLLGSAVMVAFFNNIGAIIATYLFTLIVGIILGPLWEEPGWRGFALPRLQQQVGPVLGSLILGVLWALWHLPGYVGGWMGALNAVTLLALIIGGMAFSLVATWVYNNTKGSILLMILLHSSSNAAVAVGTSVIPTDLSPGMHNFVYSGWIPAITYSVLASVILLFTRDKLSYRGPRSSGRQSPVEVDLPLTPGG